MKLETQQSYYRRIGRVVAAILDDPSAVHSVESLAAVANLSPFHFHRIYRALTGEGVGETVRRLRLAHAAWQLTERAGAVTDVAFDAGYDSPQAFARAFRQFTGISPRGFQTRQTGIAERTDRSASVEIVEVDPTTVLYIRHDGPVASIGLSYRTLFGLLRGQIPIDEPPRQIGISFGDPDGGDRFTYLAGLAATAPSGGIEGVEAVQLEGGLYACHRLVGPYSLIGPTFQALFGGWLPGSGYEPDSRPVLEFYRTRSAPRERADSVTDLMIPVREIR